MHLTVISGTSFSTQDLCRELQSEAPGKLPWDFSSHGLIHALREGAVLGAFLPGGGGGRTYQENRCSRKQPLSRAPSPRSLCTLGCHSCPFRRPLVDASEVCRLSVGLRLRPRLFGGDREDIMGTEAHAGVKWPRVCRTLGARSLTQVAAASSEGPETPPAITSTQPDKTSLPPAIWGRLLLSLPTPLLQIKPNRSRKLNGASRMT